MDLPNNTSIKVIKMKKALLAAAVSIFAVSSAYASGSGSGVYVGAAYGATKIEGDSVDILESSGITVDDKDYAYKLTLGYDINQHFAVESFYMDAGDYDLSLPSVANGVSEISGYGAAGVVKWPFSDVFSVYGKLGLWNWDAETSIGSLSTKEDDTDGYGGVGAAYRMGNFSLKAEYELYKVGDDDIWLLSAGVGYHF